MVTVSAVERVRDAKFFIDVIKIAPSSIGGGHEMWPFMGIFVLFEQFPRG